MAKKRATSKKTVTPTKLKGALTKLGVRLPHGYEITKRKRK
jgi:hypothetical protein